jgi:2-haloacid dehalogenase
MRFSLLLSDVDNTLYDFRNAERAAFAAVSARFALPDDPAVYALYQEINKRHWEKLDRGETTSRRLRTDRFLDFSQALGLNPAAVPAMSDFYVRALGEQRLPVEGAEDFLRRVCVHMPVCLITNGFSDVQRPRIQASPLRRYFTDVLISEEFAHPKPHPEMILTAMERMRVSDPARVVMIGDSEAYDILAARNAGVRSVLFAYGCPPPQTGADYAAATLRDAADWILSE